MKSNWKNKIWKYLTTLVVIFIIFNPETLELALFIDAVGLEVFLMLIEIQLITIFGAFFDKRIKPFLVYVKFLYWQTISPCLRKNMKDNPVTTNIAIQSPAIIMNGLAISALAGIVANVHH